MNAVVTRMHAFDDDGGTMRAAHFTATPAGAQLARACIDAAFDAGATAINLDRDRVPEQRIVVRAYYLRVDGAAPASRDDEPRPNSREDIGGRNGYTPPPLPTARTITFPIPPGTPRAACRSCRAPIYWIVTANKRNMPVNPDGASHFSTCANAAQHRRAR